MTRLQRFLSFPLAIILCVGLACDLGCSATQRRAEVVTASVLADTANAALPVLIAAYQAEGDRAIDAAATQADARVARDAVRVRWSPVWRAWDAVRLAHGVWATALESNGSADDINKAAGALREAYCAMRGVVPPGVALAEVVGFGCGS